VITFESSVPVGRPVMSGKTTKSGGRKPRAQRDNRVAEDDVLPEYDFSAGRPNPYASRLGDGVITVTLDPDVARVFPDARSVNEALRALARGANPPRRKRASRRR
jgi:hypothetical protein